MELLILSFWWDPNSKKWLKINGDDAELINYNYSRKGNN